MTNRGPAGLHDVGVGERMSAPSDYQSWREQQLRPHLAAARRSMIGRAPD